jgi:hypothetical protein
MKNLFLRFGMAVLVTGFTYIAFVSGTNDIVPIRHYTSPLSVEELLSQSTQDSTEFIEEVSVRRLNYASFRKSLMRHRSVYYAYQH